MKKRLAVGLVLMLGLSACSTGGDSGEAASTPARNEAQKQNQESGKNADAFQFPLTEKVELKIFATRNPAVKKDFNDMAMFKKLENQSNVHVDWEYGEAERRNLVIASGDYPDAFYGAWSFSESQISKYGSEGIFIPLEDLIDKYAPNIKKVFEQRPDLKKRLTAPNGHIYSLPMVQEDPHLNMPTSLLINKTWLDDLGLAMPATTGEFADVLRAFKTKDANKNGNPNDEIPFSFQGSGNHITNGGAFSGNFGVVAEDSQHYLRIIDGKVEFAPITEDYKQYLLYMHDLYKEGLIDPEVFTHDKNVYYAKMRSPERIVGGGFAWSPIAINQVPDAEGDYVALPPLKSPTGKEPVWYEWEPTSSLGAFTITKANKHPEITMKWIDQSYEPMTSYEMAFGPEGTTFKKNDQGKYDVIPLPKGMADADRKHAEAPGAHYVGVVLKEFREIFVADDTLQSKIDAVKIYEKYKPKQIYSSMIMDEADSEKLVDFETMVSTQVLNWKAKFIMNGNIEKEWDDYVKSFNQINVEEDLKIYQKYFDKLK